jgi:flagellar hook-length control protein FliK
MKSVNVLPVFLSQDIDSKIKVTNGQSAGNNSDSDFFNMVDRHLTDDKKITDHTLSTNKLQDTSAKNGDDIAENGKNSKVETEQALESDSQPSGQVAKSSQETKTNSLSKSDGSTQAEITEEVKTDVDDSLNSEALIESEQFISLLYHSDKTLTDRSNNSTDAKKEVNTHDNLSKQQTDIKGINTKDLTFDGEPKSELNDDAKLKYEPLLNGLPSSVQQPIEHELKVLSKEEQLAALKSGKHNASLQAETKQVLSDYQQSLQYNQGLLTSNNLSDETLDIAQQAKVQSKYDKVVDLVKSVPQKNKDLLKEQKAPDFSQQPVEPIGKVKISPDSFSEDINDKATMLDIKVATKLSSKESNDVSAKVVDKVSAEPFIVRDNTDKLSNFSSTKEVPAQINPVTSNAKQSKDSFEKLMIERSMLSPEVKDDIVEPKQVKQATNINVQAQIMQQERSQQTQQINNSDLQSIDEGVDEFAFIETGQLPDHKVKQQGSVVLTNTLDNGNSRSLAEAQSQITQTSQLKQNNDAYLNHQVSEVLNHNVAADTAQIQKNNVQLQQEVISIFKKDFADTLKDKVMVMINQKLQQFDITLDPPEFGNMQVRVNLQGEQAAVNFIVQNQQAKDALEENMHKLKNMLAEQGVDVGGANVEQQNQQKNQDDSNAKDGSNSLKIADQNNDEVDIKHVLSAKLFDSSATGIDYYA